MDPRTKEQSIVNTLIASHLDCSSVPGANALPALAIYTYLSKWMKWYYSQAPVIVPMGGTYLQSCLFSTVFQSTSISTWTKYIILKIGRDGHSPSPWIRRQALLESMTLIHSDFHSFKNVNCASASGSPCARNETNALPSDIILHLGAHRLLEGSACE